MDELQQFDKFWGYFEPKILDTLREEAKPFIGEMFEFEVAWEIEEGVYAGQWALIPRRRPVYAALENPSDDYKFIGWVPQEDVRWAVVTACITA